MLAREREHLTVRLATDGADVPYLKETVEILVTAETRAKKVVAFQVVYEGAAFDNFRKTSAERPDRR